MRLKAERHCALANDSFLSDRMKRRSCDVFKRIFQKLTRLIQRRTLWKVKQVKFHVWKRLWTHISEVNKFVHTRTLLKMKLHLQKRLKTNVSKINGSICTLKEEHFGKWNEWNFLSWLIKFSFKNHLPNSSKLYQFIVDQSNKSNSGRVLCLRKQRIRIIAS